MYFAGNPKSVTQLVFHHTYQLMTSRRWTSLDSVGEHDDEGFTWTQGGTRRNTRIQSWKYTAHTDAFSIGDRRNKQHSHHRDGDSHHHMGQLLRCSYLTGVWRVRIQQHQTCCRVRLKILLADESLDDEKRTGEHHDKRVSLATK